jgi:hypothetical protein
METLSAEKSPAFIRDNLAELCREVINWRNNANHPIPLIERLASCTWGENDELYSSKRIAIAHAIHRIEKYSMLFVIATKTGKEF